MYAYYSFIHDCTGSLLLCLGFLYLEQARPSLVEEHRLERLGSVVVEYWSSCLWLVESSQTRDQTTGPPGKFCMRNLKKKLHKVL